jgi:YD repeat-containing protein
MKKNYLRAIRLLVLVVGLYSYGQDYSPSVSSSIQFEEYPVDLFTGIPQVSIPLYTMPTLSNDVQIALSLNYHASSISKLNYGMGDTGLGWNMTSPGAVRRVISGTPDEVNWAAATVNGNDLYSFNFMGISGKFYVIKDNGVVKVKMLKNESNVLVQVEMESGTNKVAAINFYTDKSYRYRFAAVDALAYRNYDVTPSLLYSNCYASYQLSQIYDPNNNILATYNYTSYQKAGSLGANNYKLLQDITVTGIGKFEFEKTLVPSTSNWMQFNTLVVKDYNGVAVRKFKFTYNAPGIYSNLKQVDESDFAETDIKSYKLFYRAASNSPFETPAYDSWGYRTSPPCDEDDTAAANPALSAGGVLEKMTLPTGGCMIYNYESNTYSYSYGNLLSDSASYFLDLSRQQSFYNYLSTTVNSTAAITTFTVADNNTPVLFKFAADPLILNPDILDQNGNPVKTWPVFNVDGTGGYAYPYDNYNTQNFCMGVSRVLNAGMHSVSRSVYTPTTVTYTIMKPGTNQWYHGGGIRIKKIGFFADENIPQNYYDDPSATTSVPSKEISYGYNFFDNPLRSSGSLKDIEGSTGTVVYKNVTVSDSQNGRTEYNFTSPIDNGPNPDGSLRLNYDFREGNLIMKRMFNSDNEPVLQTDYTYTLYSVVDQSNPVPGTAFKFGTSKLASAVTKEYFGLAVFGGGTYNTLTTSNTFAYDANYQLQETQEVTTRGETLKTKYYYHIPSGNTINRTGAIDYVENYVGTDLLSTTKFNYFNAWLNPQGTLVNSSFLPRTIQASKGAGALETFSNINVYDQFGHKLETQKENGRKISYIWGYNNSLVIAEIENVTFGNISASLITAAQTASNTGTEADLLTALDNLRASAVVAAGQVTTYTYKPLVGILSKKDARGYKTTYEYDVNNNLARIKDQDGNIITETIQHNKPQTN